MTLPVESLPVLGLISVLLAFVGVSRLRCSPATSSARGSPPCLLSSSWWRPSSQLAAPASYLPRSCGPSPARGGSPPSLANRCGEAAAFGAPRGWPPSQRGGSRVRRGGGRVQRGAGLPRGAAAAACGAAVPSLGSMFSGEKTGELCLSLL